MNYKVQNEIKMSTKRLHNEWKSLVIIARGRNVVLKIKNLVAKYQKIRDENKITGNNRQDFVFYTALDSVLGTRPVSQPDMIISSDSGVTSKKNTDEDETDDDLTYASETEENLEEGEHGITPDDASCTDTAEETAGDRDNLSDDSFTALLIKKRLQIHTRSEKVCIFTLFVFLCCVLYVHVCS